MTTVTPSSITPIGVAVVRRSGVIDAAGGSILGSSAHELAGRSVCDIWAEMPEAIAAAHGALAGQEMVVEIEASGARWELRATPERDDAGGVRGAMLIARDHTSGELDRDRLPPGSLASLYEHVPDMIFMKRADTLRFVLFNRAGEELLGYRADELIGKNDHDLFPADEADGFGASDREVLASGQLLDIPEAPIHTRHKGTRWLHTKKIPIYDTHGAPLYLLGIAEDITERRQVDTERRELERLRSELFANVRHEVRAPLTLIAAHVARLDRGGRGHEADREHFAGIERGIESLLGLVDDLLDVAGLAARRLAPRYVELDLGQLVGQVARAHEVVAASKAITLVIDAHELVVQVDPAQVERLLGNLLGNALRHTPRGGSVRCALQDAGDRAQLVVEDSGPGIPPALWQRVFERFFQVADDPQRAGGTSLGLALVRELAELHGGAVRVDDAPQGGARFTVELSRTAPEGALVHADPRRDVTIRLPPMGQAAAAPLRSTAAMTVEPLVLVVEDNVELNRLIVEELRLSYRVATAFEGHEGLRRAVELVPDLIVTDLMMPGMNGEQMLVAIRAVPELGSVPILVLTARSEIALRVRLLHQGAQDYVMKPFAVDELIARVGNLISVKRARDILRAEVVSSRVDIAELVNDLARRTRQARFVANASIALSRSLDYQTTLSEVAHLAVPDIADACAVDVVAEDGSLRRVATAAVDPEANRLLEVPGSVVALEAREHRIGLLSLAWRAGRRHGGNERALAEALAGSAALAIDNAGLYLKARTAVGLRDEFLSIASHELRTPLQPLVIAAQTLADAFASDQVAPEVRRKLVTTVVRQVDRLRVLVDELLDGTRIETGRLVLVGEQVELGALVEIVIERSAPQLERVGCATSLHQTEPVVGCWDRSRLEQVVSNLLSNAMKFAAGTPIEITCERVAARARLAIRDHGIGIEAERHAQVFERFGRAVSARHYGGLGLGLYICRRIVEAHHGSIAVDSQPGAGSVFTVELPL